MSTEKTLFLTCQGINGERLQTQDDYLWFIGEMENAAAHSHPKCSFLIALLTVLF